MLIGSTAVVIACIAVATTLFLLKSGKGSQPNPVAPATPTISIAPATPPTASVPAQQIPTQIAPKPAVTAAAAPVVLQAPPTLAPTARTAAQPPPGPRKVAATITGSMWVTRKNGASDILRGVPVELWPSNVSKRGVIAALQVNYKRVKESAAFDRKSATDFRNQFGAQDDTAANYDKEAAKKEAIAAQITEKVQQLPATMTPPEAYELINRLSDIPGVRGIMDPVGADACILRGRSGADGKYKLTGQLLPGTYYLRAAEMNDAFSIDWLVPITISDEQPVSADLFNDNAADIYNFSAH